MESAPVTIPDLLDLQRHLQAHPWWVMHCCDKANQLEVLQFTPADLRQLRGYMGLPSLQPLLRRGWKSI